MKDLALLILALTLAAPLGAQPSWPPTPEQAAARVDSLVLLLDGPEGSRTASRLQGDLHLLISHPESPRASFQAAARELLEHVRAQETNPYARASILAFLGDVRHQDRSAIFLEQVARTDSGGDLGLQAVQALDAMGGPGVAALRRIVNDPEAPERTREYAELALRAGGEIEP